MVNTFSFRSPEELALFAIGKTGLVFVVGTQQECESLVEEIEDLITSTEQIVHVERDDKLFEGMEPPDVLPAVGYWSSAGCLVGYQEQGESIAEFLKYARGD
ncbi:MAG: hypothetical protein KDA68_05460 [Planctomycetaceae bacterium]|nr:hypothetical protein [Planctomycetaceae bacterium]